MDETQDYFRVCLCGAESVGKTSFLLRFLHGDFEGGDDPTIENSHSINIVVDNKTCNLDILDTGGNNAYHYLHEKWFVWPDAFLVMFSTTTKYTLDMVPHFLKKIEATKTSLSKSVIFIVGTQCDEVRPRQTTKEQALELAYHYNCNYLETSAKTGTNVRETFQQLIRELRTKKKETVALSTLENGKDKKVKRKSLVPSKFISKEKRQEKEKKKEEEKNVQMDAMLSLLKDPERRKQMVKKIPKHKVVPLRTKMEVVTIIGPPDDESAQTYKELVCARSVSTYPKKTPDSNVRLSKETREGDPVCDQYYLTHFENRTILAVADGCNWGEEVKLAAQKASRVFVEYMKKHQKEIKTTREVGYIILRAFMAAHDSIVEGRTAETLFQAGTTTMLGGMMLELEDVPDTKWAFVFANLGDCKAYHWSCKTGLVTDLTAGNRQNVMDARDPGGRLGPYVEGGHPDLRNLMVDWYPCVQGDIISVVSDGVHDNLDPQHLGKLPHDLNIKVKENNWTELEQATTTPLYQEADKIKTLFAHKFVNAMIGGEKSLQVATKTTPSIITGKFIEHALTVTKAGREFMEQNPGKKLPKDYVRFPGKMDHATCVSFEIGTKKGEKEPPMHKKTNTDPSLYWEEYKTEEGEKYFYNTVTKKSTWEDPFIKVEGSEWKAYYDEDGEVYYYNTKTGDTGWEIPHDSR